jgi:2-polyprenyl-3-methyl-5-hydroxy-6-metoxy-1,4-benzoquinol methylase
MAALYESRDALREHNPRLASYYERLPGSRTERFFDESLERLSDLTGKKQGSILDVACGNGHFLWRAKLRGWSCKGIETSAVQAREARERLGLEVVSQSVEEFSNGEAFDCVTLWDFIEHVPNPRDILAKVRSWLRPGGMVLVATPNHASLINFIAAAMFRCSFGRVRMPLETLVVPEHVLYFTEKTAARLLEESGFKIREIVKTGTDIDRYETDMLFNLTAKALLAASKLLRWENRVVLFAERV